MSERNAGRARDARPRGARRWWNGGLAFVLALGAACVPEPAPASPWTVLTAAPVRRERTGEPAAGVRLERVGEGAWLRAEIPAEAWEPSGKDGTWHAPQPVMAIGRPPDGGTIYTLRPHRARRRDRPGVPHRGRPAPRRRAGHLHDHSGESGRVRLCLAPQDAEAARVAMRAVDRRPHHAGVGAAQGPVGACSRSSPGWGGASWCGPASASSVPCGACPPTACLRFATASRVRRACGRACDRPWHTLPRFACRGPGNPQRVEPFEHRQDRCLRGRARALARAGAAGRGWRRLTFTFEVEGPFAYTSFLRSGGGPPASVGSYGARPADWPASAPNVVVFLADTLRADRLATYGERGCGADAATWTPSRAAALAFRNAWSVSTHTLPDALRRSSPALYPRQNGQVDFFHPLPRGRWTPWPSGSPEAAGYRTVPR